MSSILRQKWEKWKKSASVLPILRIVLPKFSPEKKCLPPKEDMSSQTKSQNFSLMVKGF
jgi:hypothetical protein